eukprot:TRINITY_DN5865_c0_g2_i1.p1 TRINITY_DN5865_c0_g2~~TRINITY_DN5865_c0_g2_i1.p1  ORF type:complete len:199 (+),score=64.34 TRINITY_DN5865_c0_g2_i1:210-806(+)
MSEPECLVGLRLCSRMMDNEAIIISGAEQFSTYAGYGHSFKWDGDFQDPSPRSGDGSVLRAITCYDAIVSGGSFQQFRPRYFRRDVLKAYVAFRAGPDEQPDSDGLLPAVATGNWGCGAFGGDKQLKFFQQLLAAAEARRPLHYFTFKDARLAQDLQAFVDKLEATKPTVAELYNTYVKHFEEVVDHAGVLDMLQSRL